MLAGQNVGVSSRQWAIQVVLRRDVWPQERLEPISKQVVTKTEEAVGKGVHYGLR